MLVKQYIRAIRELQPRVFVMENVSMLRSDVHRFYLDEVDAKLIGQYDIPMTPTKLILLEKKFMFDDALEIVQDVAKISLHLWPEEEYAALNVIYKVTKNAKKLITALEKLTKDLLSITKMRASENAYDYIGLSNAMAFSAISAYYQGEYDLDLLQNAIASAIMIQRMLGKALEIFENHLVVDTYSAEGNLSAEIRSYAVFDYLQSILSAEPNNYAINADVLCAADYGVPKKECVLL